MSADMVRWNYPLDAAILRDLREELTHYLEGSPLDEKRQKRMVLCADEAAANIIEHSQVPEGVRPIFEIEACLDDGFLKLTFSDNGQPFDSTKSPLVDLEAHIRSGKKGGLGVQIMRMNLDIFKYSREEEHNVFTLGMRL